MYSNDIEVTHRIRVFAIASAGGHWEELMALRDALKDCRVLYATTFEGLPDEFGATPAVIVPDCNRRQPLRTFLSILTIGYRLVRFRPDVVVSTGALPGIVALVLSKSLLRAKTIWVDSVANAEEMSLSGKLARRFADLWISQWPHVAKREGARFFGAVL